MRKSFTNEASSVASCVRIAFAIKGDIVERPDRAATSSDASSSGNRSNRIDREGLVPAVMAENGSIVTQSVAIIEYINELWPDPPLLPRDHVERALTRSIALTIASEIHAFLPPRVGHHLRAALRASYEDTMAWTNHWLFEGLEAVERLLATNRRGTYTITSEPTIADILLYPQAIRAKREGLELARWPNIAEVVSKLDSLPAFSGSVPTAEAHQ